MSTKQELDVYLHQVYAGRLTRDTFGTMSFTYESAYVTQNLPTLSFSLPPRKAPYRGKIVQAFFFGALPGFLTGRRKFSRLIRHWLWNLAPDQLAHDYKARYMDKRLLGPPERKRWTWLVEKGVEVGAIYFCPACNASPLVLEGDREVGLDGRILSRIDNDPEYDSVDGRHCMIPARLDRERRVMWVRGRSPTLSTHFVKYVSKGDCPLNELFCMRLARSVGLVVPNVEVRAIDGNLCYLIERYDRKRLSRESGSVEMLHQESLCQALGIPVGIWIERHGGPSVKQSLAFLHQHSSKPMQDKAEFLARLVFGYLIGCLDINGRNVSLLYRNGCPELAPAYDLSMSMVPANLAMSIGGVRTVESVRLQHWCSAVAEGDWQILWQQLHRLSAECEEKAFALAGQMEQEGLRSDVYQLICTGIAQRTGLIRQQLPKWPEKAGC